MRVLSCQGAYSTQSFSCGIPRSSTLLFSPCASTVSKLNPDEIDGDDLTGGYILKFDWFYTGDNIGGFESDNDGMIYNYHYPKPSEIVLQQEEYIQDFINTYENIMLNNDYTNDSTDYPSMINVESFVDFIILQEFAKNVDAYRLSTYFYKDKESIDNRLTAGPIWDFNHGFGNCDYGETWETQNWLLEYNPEGGDQMSFWWERLWQDDNFKTQVSQRYSELRSNFLSETNLNNIIDSSVIYLGAAVDRNFTKWPLLGNYVWPNYYVFDTYNEEIDYLKSWISDRLNWMDSQILLLESSPPINAAQFEFYSAYPNPFNPAVNIKYKLHTESFVNITIYDLAGNKIKTLVQKNNKPGFQLIQWNGTNKHGNQVSSGVYLYKITSNDFKKTGKIMLTK